MDCFSILSEFCRHQQNLIQIFWKMISIHQTFALNKFFEKLMKNLPKFTCFLIFFTKIWQTFSTLINFYQFSSASLIMFTIFVATILFVLKQIPVNSKCLSKFTRKYYISFDFLYIPLELFPIFSLLNKLFPTFK